MVATERAIAEAKCTTLKAELETCKDHLHGR